MRLDDRPVIDQLTEPTPLNIVNEVWEMFSDDDSGIRTAIELALLREMSTSLTYLREVDEDGDMAAERESFLRRAEDEEYGRRQALVDAFAEALEERLGARL